MPLMILDESPEAKASSNLMFHASIFKKIDNYIWVQAKHIFSEIQIVHLNSILEAEFSTCCSFIYKTSFKILKIRYCLKI